MPLMRAQAILKHRSGLPRDNVVNVFHFETATEGAAEAEDAADLVAEFYETGDPAVGFPIAGVLGYQIASVGHEIRVYPVDEPTGRDYRGEGMPPLFTRSMTFSGREPQVGRNLPSEVAVCLSYKNSSPSTEPPARRRGRLYIGPFLESAGVEEDEAGSEASRPTAALRQRILDAGEYLARGSGLPQWSIYSRPFAGRAAGEKKRANGTDLPAIPARAGQIHTITDLWVDNAWDTVRRRGERPTSRLSGVPAA